VQIF